MHFLEKAAHLNGSWINKVISASAESRPRTHLSGRLKTHQRRAPVARIRAPFEASLLTSKPMFNKLSVSARS
jgi:hypothetical protein